MHEGDNAVLANGFVVVSFFALGYCKHTWSVISYTIFKKGPLAM